MVTAALAAACSHLGAGQALRSEAEVAGGVLSSAAVRGTDSILAGQLVLGAADIIRAAGLGLLTVQRAGWDGTHPTPASSTVTSHPQLLPCEGASGGQQLGLHNLLGSDAALSEAMVHPWL